MGITKVAASSCASPPVQTGCPGTLTTMPRGKPGRVCFCSVGVRAALRVGVTTFMRLQQGSKDPALPAGQPDLELLACLLVSGHKRSLSHRKGPSFPLERQQRACIPCP